MRRFFAAIIILCAAVSLAAAQSTAPRSMGFRIGATGFDATYQHSFQKGQFLQGDVGVDFGYNVNGRPGMRATAVYDFIWARPAWTNRGYWALYAGPGLSLGYVNDMVMYRIGEEVKYTSKSEGSSGFMIGLAAQVGIEYTFDFPLILALEVRPVFGIHVNDDVNLGGFEFDGKTGFYDNGMMGFVPTLAVRYRF